MNELEIAYWNVINKEIDLNEVPNDHFIELLMMTALQAKRMTCEKHEIQIFEAFLGHNYPQFMINYETWKKQLESVTDEERSFLEEEYKNGGNNFEAINESFRQLYADSITYAMSDQIQDLNFMVDSLEDEHTRRAVHTTKTIQELERE